MNIAESGGHTLKRYDKDMLKLQKRVLTMGDMVHQQLDRLQQASEAITEDTIQEIADAEDAIDRQEIKVDKYIVKMLARRSPVGGDLRFIVVCSRIASSLEAVGDETAQIAKTLLDENWRLADCENIPALPEVAGMLILLAELFEKSMKTFESYDYKEAKEIADGLASPEGELQARMNRLVEHCRASQGDVSNAVSLALIIRSMQRGLRQVQNISRHVIYLLTATDVRHQEHELR